MATSSLATHRGVVVDVVGPRMWQPLLCALLTGLTTPQRLQLCQRLQAQVPGWHSIVTRCGVSGALLALCSMASMSDWKAAGHGGWAAQQTMQVEGRAHSVQRVHTHPLLNKPQELSHVLLTLAEARENVILTPTAQLVCVQEALVLLNVAVVVTARDLDAADHDSQALLLHLLQLERPILVLASVHASGDVGHLRAQLVATPHVSLVALPPLSHHDTQQLMQVVFVGCFVGCAGLAMVDEDRYPLHRRCSLLAGRL